MSSGCQLMELWNRSSSIERSIVTVLPLDCFVSHKALQVSTFQLEGLHLLIFYVALQLPQRLQLTL
jgi:hypothetical protein